MRASFGPLCTGFFGSAFLAVACSSGDPVATGSGGTSGAGGTVASGGAPVGSGGGPSGSGGGALGAPSGGTSSGTGGGPVGPTEAPWYPTTVTLADSTAAYQAWKDIHLEDCGNGVQRVRWENERLDATVSEGIGYGMLLAVIHGEQAVFDGLLAYGKLMRAPFSTPAPFPGGPGGTDPDNGLMNWLRYGCDAHRDTKYNEYPDFAASDADLDMAMALLMAECRFGDSKYAGEATTVINAIKNDMFINHNGLELLQPGDSAWFDQLGAGCVNYSYFAPAYYREFAKHVTADAAFWNKAADDSYELLAVASDPNTGLVRNWGSADGGDATADCHNAYNRAASYGDDAARTPWRIATDYVWYDTPEAKAWTDKVTTWVKSVGIQEIVQWYRLDGQPDTEANTWDDHTVVNIGPFAVGALSYDQATANEFAAELLAIPTSQGSHDAEYFPRMLKGLSLASLTGKFTVCGGN